MARNILVEYANKLEPLFQDKKYDELIDVCNKMLFLDEKNTDALFYLARANWKQDKNDEVMEICNRLLSIDDRHAKGHNLKGLVFADKKEYEKAFDEYKKALELDPKNKDAQKGLKELGVCDNKDNLI